MMPVSDDIQYFDLAERFEPLIDLYASAQAFDS